MANIQDQITKARTAGYSDEDIAAHLSKTSEYGSKMQTALNAGYKPSEILAHLAPSEVPTARTVGGFLSNVGTSAKNLAGGLAHAVMHPLDTIGSTLDVAAGALQNALPKPLVDFVNQNETPEALAAGKRAVDAANAAGGFYKDRYGSVDAIKKTLYEDPVGAAADLSTLLTGGAAAAGKVGLAGTKSALNTAAKVTNPLSAVAPTVKTANALVEATPVVGPAVKSLNELRQQAGTGAANVAATATGALLGKSPESLKQAYAAGKIGDTTFIENMRGQVPADQILSEIKQGLSNMQTANVQAYKTAKTGWAANPTPIDFAPIDQALTNVKDSLQQGGKWKIGTAERAKIDEIGQVVDEWRQDPTARTAVDLDALKQRIDAIYPDSPQQTQAQRAVTAVRNAIKNQIVNNAPDYANAMKSYEEQLGVIRDINKALGAGDKIAKETAINKAMSLLKKSPSAEFRQGLVQQLQNEGGVNVMPAIAGQELSSFMPTSGIGKSIAGGGLTMATVLHHPELAAVLPFTSPRLMGEAFYGMGRASGAGGRMMNALRSGQTGANLTPAQMNQLAIIAAQQQQQRQNTLAP